MSNTRVYKGVTGWRAETTAEIAEGRELELSTYKDGQCIRTVISAAKIDGSCRVHVIHEDLWKVLRSVQARCTEKNVRVQHEAVIRQHGLAHLIEQAEKFYTSKEAA